jgi:arylsulfatase A-like enzyme
MKDYRANPNIIIIILDTARAQSFSCYGYNRETTPNIDRISQEGILFENAISPSPWTLPSHASIFTGMYPSRHGCHEKHKFLNRNLPTLPEILKNIGYRTIGISNNSWISRNFGFERGFDTFIKLWQIIQYETDLADASAKGKDKYKRAMSLLFKGNPFVNIVNGVYGKYFWRRYDYGARRINRIVKKLLHEELARSTPPFFIFINYLEPHLIYRAPDPFFSMFLAENVSKKEALSVNQNAWNYMGGIFPMTEADFEVLRALYDAELFYLDYRIGEVYEFLKETNLLGNTLLIITSDHGENIGEHNLMDHQYCLYDTLLKVPFIMRLPGVFEDGKRIGNIVQTTDIFPTIIELLSLQDHRLLGGIQGESLLRNGNNRFAVSEYIAPQPPIEEISRRYPEGNFSKYNSSLTSMRSHEWKLIVSSSGKDELFNVIEDQDETQNLLNVHKSIFKDMRSMIDSWVKEHKEDIEDENTHITAEIKKRLEALGYFT